MTRYSVVLSEDETIDRALAGSSLARFGDGEFRLACGGTSLTQKRDARLTAELREILSTPGPALVCVPHARADSPKRANWASYAQPKYLDLLKLDAYGSAFITRPDSAPWIDRGDYWDKVVDLWRNKDVILVAGTERSLTVERLAQHARTVRCVTVAPRDAYDQIDTTEHLILGMNAILPGPVIACAGAAATVLCARLARSGVHAMDLGHVGMFMRRRDEVMTDVSAVASDEYRAVLRKRYEKPGWGGSGGSHAEEVMLYAAKLGATSVLDYGCGRGTLKKMLPDSWDVREYDPGIIGKDTPPQPADLVVATDVLEHVEPERLLKVLWHLRALARKGLFLVIATSTAKEILPDGRNAHLIVKPSEWWTTQLAMVGLSPEQTRQRKGFTVWIRKVVK